MRYLLTYNFIFEEKNNKELNKNDVKRKDNFGNFAERQFASFPIYLHGFCHTK